MSVIILKWGRYPFFIKWGRYPFYLPILQGMHSYAGVWERGYFPPLGWGG